MYSNFLGGKRVLTSQAALDVAVHRARWETGMLLKQDEAQLKESALPLVYWDGHNKYAYFFIELTSEDDDIDVRCADVEGRNPLEWVKQKQLLDPAWVKAEVHDYAASTVQDLNECGVLKRLADIFGADDPAAGIADLLAGIKL